jgi:hypothetical protein
MRGTFHERRLSGVRARDRVIPTHLAFGTRRGTACQLNDGGLSIIGRSKSIITAAPMPHYSPEDPRRIASTL